MPGGLACVIKGAARVPADQGGNLCQPAPAALAHENITITAGRGFLLPTAPQLPLAFGLAGFSSQPKPMRVLPAHLAIDRVTTGGRASAVEAPGSETEQ